MAEQDKNKGYRSLLPLAILWLMAAASDRLWFALDRSVPAWDQAEYLTGTLNYWRVLQHPQWLSGEWWTNFWLLSSKIPPLTYILTVPFLNVFGLGSDRATLVHLLFSAVLIASIYGLGLQLFNRQVGLWAAIISLLFPALYRFRLQFLLDYPLTAAVTLSFYCLTMWKGAGEQGSRGAGEQGIIPNLKSAASLLWAIAFGISFGLAILVKHTAILFLFTPIIWLGVGAIRQKAWVKLAQLAGSLLLSIAIFGPWAKTNWLLILTAGKRATIDSAIAEGDPALNTLDAWIYYWNKLPEQVSWPLLLFSLVGLLLYTIKKLKSQDPKDYCSIFAANSSIFNSLNWLTIFWVGAYLISSLNINKDARYVLPYLPVFSIFLAYCLTLWPRRWGKLIRFTTVSLAIILMFLNIWPIGGSLGNNLTHFLSPAAQYQAKLGKKWPHQEVISEILQTEPYLRSTLGVLPSTPEINQHNINYFGAMENFQVYGRQVGTKLEQVTQDVRSLSWFLTKTGEQGSIRKRIKKAQAAIVSTIENNLDFQLQKTWLLPDNTNLNLYHKRLSPINVQLLSEARSKVKLGRVIVPEKSPPGVPIPVTYEWSGPWQQLQSGLVLITWRNQQSNSINYSIPISRFINDHAIGFGELHRGFLRPDQFTVGFKVIERMAMFPPLTIEAGTYQLEATYLNRKTGESYSMNVPRVSIEIEQKVLATNAATNELLTGVNSHKNTDNLSVKSATQSVSNYTIPELDLVTQLRIMAINLPKGIKGLETVFEQIGRINQYDPIQDYTIQAEQALEYRLTQEPNNLEWAYALAFSRALQQNVEGTIAALERVTQLDSKNPNAYGYLAFVHIYNWHPKAAQVALQTALTLNPNQPEIQALNGVAALMQGNILQAWHDLQAIKKLKL
ncbi:phospholipid carrier-dependent glycosyltransferase [Kamptonema sp. UHCC 0994]|uniref:phospholipid carrier-dependent glycosyltransferase n=1 Tax=Kamptonema sp. UHCC 0994 TaxID=3031329 RepID=UPI0023B90F3A|nr:phospholipid carrier-dependent glycosyltransferase [Kamptonema sp. UHCC 0994]MDF0553176.1 phospholipid carrier-dependent glycosyltransferase [Kamptonema sp. UHCC 0994]